MEKVNKNRLAEHFGVSLGTVSSWVRRGAPYLVRGAQGRCWEFNVDQISKWRNTTAEIEPVSDTVSLTAERIRLTKINADRKALQLAREQGKLIDTEVAMKLWGAVIQIISNKLDAIPVKLAPLARATSSDMEAKEIIDKFIREVKEELSNPNLAEVAGMIDDKPDNKHVKGKKKTVSGKRHAKRRATI